jgi:cytochrome c-type biogenesis protein CcmE
MKLKPVYIIVALLIAVSAILAFDTFSSYVNSYSTVSEIAGDDSYVGREVQILANVTNRSIRWVNDGSLLFNITDGKATIAVTYSGVPPQSFTDRQKVVAIGVQTTPYHMNATQLLVKCPSKYE